MRNGTYSLGKKTHQRKGHWVAFFVLLGLIITLLLCYFFYIRPKQPTSTPPSRSSEPSATSTASSGKGNRDNPQKTPVQYEGTDANKTENLSGFITYKSVNNGILVIRNVINQNIGSGKCTLHLTQNSKSFTKEVPVAQNPSSSTCQGFDVPFSELGAGNWSIVIDITDSSGRIGKMTSEITI